VCGVQMKALWVRAATAPQPTDLLVGTALCVAIAVLCGLLHAARAEHTRRQQRHRQLLGDPMPVSEHSSSAKEEQETAFSYTRSGPPWRQKGGVRA
jgi:hypothetical protein